MSTLDVLIVGLVAISVFETILGILRTYLFAPRGRVSISLAEEGADIVFNWIERGGPPVKRRQKEGVGSLLVRTTVNGQFGGRAFYDWKSEGVTIRLSIPKERLG